MTRFEKTLLWTSTLTLLVTGLVYEAMEWFVEPSDPFAVVRHPLQPVLLKIHILSAPVLVFAFGLVFTRHVWRQYRSRMAEGRRTGVWSLVNFFLMAASGTLLQTASSPAWLEALAWIHLISGTAFGLGFAGHALLARALVRRTRRAPSTLGVTSAAPVGVRVDPPAPEA